MPWTDPDSEGGALHGPTAWRAMIIFSLLINALVIFGIVVLFQSNRDRVVENHALACRIGTFFVGQPISPQPDQTNADFQETLDKAESFLLALRSSNCEDVAGAQVTEEQINRSLRQIHQAQR